jgi:hypothetical protein
MNFFAYGFMKKNERGELEKVTIEVDDVSRNK